MTTYALRVGLVATGLCFLSGMAAAASFQLTASSSHPPVIPWVKTIQDHVVPESTKRAAALGHTIKWTEAYAGALYNFQNTLKGIEDGLGDLGWVGTLWEPGKLPLHNVTFYTPFVTDDTKIAADICNDLHANIEAVSGALLKHKQIYLGPQSIDDYVLITKKPINSIADLKGLKLYGPGATAQWLNRDRGKPRGSSPPAPPDIRVRIRRFDG